MSRRPRRNHAPGFKAKVALAEQFDVHPNQITTWKAQLENGATNIFSPNGTATAQPAIDVKSLHAKIGETDAGKRFLRNDGISFWLEGLENKAECLARRCRLLTTRVR